MGIIVASPSCTSYQCGALIAFCFFIQRSKAAKAPEYYLCIAKKSEASQALKERNILAQGNALGKQRNKT